MWGEPGRGNEARDATFASLSRCGGPCRSRRDETQSVSLARPTGPVPRVRTTACAPRGTLASICTVPVAVVVVVVIAAAVIDVVIAVVVIVVLTVQIDQRRRDDVAASQLKRDTHWNARYPQVVTAAAAVG